MTLAAFALLGATIMVSSFVSGVFGMAGGLILLGVLLTYFDVPAAMILFSIIQFFANGWRALQWRAYVRWPIFFWYVAGAAIAFAAVAFSLVIACVARTHDSVMPIGAVAAMVMSAIGGCWWPVGFEPSWIRSFAQVLPTTWTMEAYNNLMIRQTDAISAMWPSVITAGVGTIGLVVGMVAASILYE